MLKTPSGHVLRFLTTSLQLVSAATLAAHLVSPLLGICSGLLSLLSEHATPLGPAVLTDTDSPDRATLFKRIEGAIDASGSAERIKQGTAVETFARVGGPELLGRWIQHTLGVREKDLGELRTFLGGRGRAQRPAPAIVAATSPRLT